MDDFVIVPHWLNALLKVRFNQHCEHRGHNGNQKNLFCLECRISICKDCGDHTSHRLLKIFTYHSGGNRSYAAVKLDNTNELLDCSRIQPRMHNGAQVLFIKETPETSHRGNNCERDGCDATVEHHNSFCSIDCKVNHIMSAPSNYRNARRLLNRMNLP